MELTEQQLKAILCKAYEIFIYRQCGVDKAKDTLASWISGYLLISIAEAQKVMLEVLNACRRITINEQK